MLKNTLQWLIVFLVPSAFLFLRGDPFASWFYTAPMAVVNWVLASGNLVDKTTLVVSSIVMIVTISISIWKVKGLLSKLLVSGIYHLYCGFIFILIAGSVG